MYGARSTRTEGQFASVHWVKADLKPGVAVRCWVSPSFQESSRSLYAFFPCHQHKGWWPGPLQSWLVSSWQSSWPLEAAGNHRKSNQPCAVNWCWGELVLGNLHDQESTELLYCSFLARNVDQHFQMANFCLKMCFSLPQCFSKFIFRKTHLALL